jgi:hypothetical protein
LNSHGIKILGKQDEPKVIHLGTKKKTWKVGTKIKVVKRYFYWNIGIMPCSLLKVSGRFGVI